MLILRQKEYNSKARKLVRTVQSLQNVNNRSGRFLTNTVSGINKGKAKLLTNMNKTLNLPSIDNKIMKYENLSRTENAAKKVDRIARKINSGTTHVVSSPGTATKDLVTKTIENPVTTVTGIGGKAAMLIPGPVGTAATIIPTGTIGTGLEQGILKKSKAYEKATKGLSKKFKESKVADGVETLGNSLGEYVRNMPL